MLEWWNALQPLEQVLYIIALPATVVLLLQTILTLVGLGHGADVDHDGSLDGAGAGGDFDHDGGVCEADHSFEHTGEAHADHDGGFHLLTVRGIVAFLTIFGWVGIALLDMGLSAFLALPIAVVAGGAAMFLVAVLLKLALDMQQSGNLDVHNALGLTGEVYVPIEPGAKGKVTLVLQERFTELDAVCDQPLKTGQAVRVIDVADDGVLVVAPIVR